MEMKRETQEKILAVLLSVLLIIGIIPLFILARYNVPSADDYSYAIISEPIWRETHSVLLTLWDQIKNAADTWKTWQGTYFAEWFSLSAIAFFGRDAYFMTPYITLLPMIICELAAAWVIFCKGLGTRKSQAAIVALPCILFQVLLPPSGSEAFYWMCGATLYTSIYAFSMLDLAFLTLFLLDNRKSRKKTVLLEILIGIFTFMMAGSTYIAAMCMLLTYVCMTAWCYYRRHPHKKVMLLFTLLFIIGLLASIFSPGAANRQNSAGEGLPAFTAILLSLKEAAVYIKTWSIPPVLLMLFFMSPVLWSIVKIKKYAYRLPLLVTIVSFGIYAAQFTPCLYALGIIGAYRVQNMYRFQMYILLLGNELYWIGWLHGKFSQKVWKPRWQKDFSLLLPVGILGILLTGGLLLYYGGSTVTTVSALQSLRKKEAQRYYEQYQERLVLLEDESVTDVVLKPYELKPYLLHFNDITVDPGDWVNQAMSQYYGKNSVVLSGSDDNYMDGLH